MFSGKLFKVFGRKAESHDGEDTEEDTEFVTSELHSEKAEDELDIRKVDPEDSESGSDLSSDLELELDESYESCPDCNQPYTKYDWCKDCNGKRFQQDFPHWTSGNELVDGFIRETQLNAQYSTQVLEWIPHDKLEDIEYLDKGGFSTVYTATWLDGPIKEWSYEGRRWIRLNEYHDRTVILKRVHDSSSLGKEFLNEWKSHYDCYKSSGNFIRLNGFTQDPKTLDYIMVMEYAFNGSLRKSLPDIVKDDWYSKLSLLYNIIGGLESIHKLNFVHRNLHDGNILQCYLPRISDVGLCKPADRFHKDEVYGVLPFVAPEVLRRKPYTPAGDIYGFAMIMWEITSGVPPFNDKNHDLHLAQSVCRGEHPEIVENTPQCYVNLMKSCWDNDPSRRPTASKVKDTIENWYNNINKSPENIKEELKGEIIEFWKADEISKQNQTTTLTEDGSSGQPLAIDTSEGEGSHPQVYFTSRLLDFTKKLNEILDEDDNSHANEFHQEIGNDG